MPEDYRVARGAVPATGAGGLLWSHRCAWNELLVPFSCEASKPMLELSEGWTSRWTVTWKTADGEVTCPVRDLAGAPVSWFGSVRTFTWRRSQRHRPGLQYLVSTGRHHGFESLEEARLLMVLDFAAAVVDVLAQPVRLKFATSSGWRKHIPDFLAVTRRGVWLIDVRPRALLDEQTRISFAAAAEAALAAGWHYVVVAGWRAHVETTLGTLSSQRRPLSDPLGLRPGLLEAAADGGATFGELAERSDVPAVARAQLLHLLWHRRLGIDLAEPLTDRSTVVLQGDLR